MCQFCPQIVAYRVDANRNLIPIYDDEDGPPEVEGTGPADAFDDPIAIRMARILALHPQEDSGGSLSNDPGVA